MKDKQTLMYWFDVAPVDEFKPGQAKLVDADDVMIAVYNLNGEIYALEDNCSHHDVPILGCGLTMQELVEGEQLICPRHGARFDIKTGKALTPPAFDDVATFPVRVENGMIQVRDNRQD